LLLSETGHIDKEHEMTKASRRYIAELWCKMWHQSPMWPSHGHYQCRTCGREYPVPWESGRGKTTSQHKNEILLADASRLIGNPIARATQVAHSS
jgi:hypothetical protein